MINPASGQRRIVIRANRETAMLVIAASAATFALAFAIRSRPPEPPAAEVAQLHQDWTGHLAEVSDQTGMAATEPMTSASLVVPKAQLALPNPAVRPKPRSCDSNGSCGKSPATIARAKAERTDMERLEAQRNRSFMSRLNPLNHMPDMTTLGRPFAYAGETISGWMNRF